MWKQKLFHKNELIANNIALNVFIVLTRKSVPDTHQSISETESYETGASTNGRAEDLLCIWPQYIRSSFHICFQTKPNINVYLFLLVCITEQKVCRQAADKKMWQHFGDTVVTLFVFLCFLEHKLKKIMAATPPETDSNRQFFWENVKDEKKNNKRI